MIKIGTVCLLVGDHSRAGQCCTTTSDPFYTEDCYSVSRGEIRSAWFYLIHAPYAGDAGFPDRPWAAQRQQLIPLAPPGFTEDESSMRDVRQLLTRAHEAEVSGEIEKTDGLGDEAIKLLAVHIGAGK